MKNARQVRDLLKVHGSVRSQPAGDWTGQSSLPEELALFYESVGPVDIVIPGYGNPYFLPSLAKLWEEQMGYIYATDGSPLEGWNPEWLVIADEGGDPFIFDTAHGKILHDCHGQGEWDPVELFADVYAMAASLAVIGSVVTEAGDDLTDEAEYIKPARFSDVCDRVSGVVGSEAEALEILATLGWATS